MLLVVVWFDINESKLACPCLVSKTYACDPNWLIDKIVDVQYKGRQTRKQFCGTFLNQKAARLDCRLTPDPYSMVLLSSFQFYFLKYRIILLLWHNKGSWELENDSCRVSTVSSLPTSPASEELYSTVVYRSATNQLPRQYIAFHGKYFNAPFQLLKKIF